MRNQTKTLLTLACVAMAGFVLPAAAGKPPVQLPDPDAKPPAAKPVPKPARKNAKLPGIVIDFQNRCVDIEASVCLDRGFLELIACTKGSKEHESIVAINAKAMHIHASLLALGANRGNPAMQKPVNKAKTRWVHLPPAGDPVDVFLVFKNKKGKMTEHPISDFVARSDKSPDEMGGAEGKADKKEDKFPNTFIFAGSLLGNNKAGQRKYLSDLSGNVISISTFGDELLCLPGDHARDNGSLMWRVDAAELPKVGTKVTLRLRPKPKPAATTRPR
ncbi:MAG: YdjY domain-containing protein [Phycisphaerae bacterium]|jgi:hypothetical protein|nr:YdjY domain-containing protein [Phycisphaerae bacterium]